MTFRFNSLALTINKYFQETIAVTERILTELWRRKRSLLFWSIFPIFLVLLNTYIFAARADLSIAEGVKFSASSSLVGAALFFSCLGGTVSTIVAEREQKTIKRLFIAPLHGVCFFAGIFLAHTLIGLTQAFLVYILAISLGANFNASFSLSIAIILLSIIAYVGMGFVLGTQLAKRIDDINALIATFGVPLMILGGSFLPSSLFPAELIKLAKFDPIYHMNEALLEVWARDNQIQDILPHLYFLLAFALAMNITAWLAYKTMLIKEKNL